MSAGQRGRGPGAERASLLLKLTHAAVFLSFAGLALHAGWPELRQLALALRGPWHAGTPPSWPAVLGCAASAVGGLVILLRLAQRREVTLYVSGAVLVGLVAAVVASGREAERRSPQGANLWLLELSRALQGQMGARLQERAAVPDAPEEWEASVAALAARGPSGSPLRDRLFRPVAPRPVRVEDPAWKGEGAAPGTIGVWISPDRVEFSLTPIGLGADGRPERLLDDRGGPIRLRGLYDPDARGAPAP